MAKRSLEDVERTRAVLIPICDADTLTEVVRLSLRRDILSLALAPGIHVTLRELKARYGVGATPLREALWSLIGESLIENEAQVGYRVADASRDRLAGIAGVRQHVEPWALGQAMHRAHPSWLASVEGPMRALHRLMRWSATHVPSIRNGASTPVVPSCAAGGLWDAGGAARGIALVRRNRPLSPPDLADAGRYRGNKGDHGVLYEAVRAGDVALAVKTLGTSYRRYSRRVISSYSDGASCLAEMRIERGQHALGRELAWR